MKTLIRILTFLALAYAADAQQYPCPKVNNLTINDGSSTLNAGVVRLGLGITQIEVTDYCSPTQIASDISACAQNAINAAQAFVSTSYGGTVVHFPARWSPYKLASGTLAITKSFVSLVGDAKQASYISCANGASDCIRFGQPFGSQIRDNKIENLGIIGSGKTAGAGVHITNVYRSLIQNVTLENMVRGFENDATGGNTNAVTLRDVTIVPNQASSDYGIYWHAPGDGSNRSDVMTLDNVVVDGQWSGATGIMLDGFVQTTVGSSIRVLHMANGLRVVNSAGSSSYYPSFINWHDFEAEGFTSRSVSIEAGAEFKFVNSDMTNMSGAHGTTDDYAVAILADAGASVTRAVSITNSRIGLSQKSGLYTEARNVQVTNVQFASTSEAGANLYPVISVAATAQNSTFTSIVTEEYGGLGRASYGISIASGATNISAANFTTSGLNSTPWYSDPGSALKFNIPKGGFGTFDPAEDANPVGMRIDQNGQTLFLVRNSNATGSQAGFKETTATANSWCNHYLDDNGGSPIYRIDSCGGGVVSAQAALPVDSTAYNYSSPSSGSTVTIGDQQDDAYIDGANTIATLTISLPGCGANYNGKLSRIVTQPAITSLKVTTTEGTVNNAPTTLPAFSSIAYKCIGSATKWFRIQ